MTDTSGEIKISIVLCTYNGEKYLHEQLHSLVNQTFPFYELIISDDASTDTTRDIIRDFEKKDSRIKIFQNTVNLGLNKNFEKAIRHSTGNWIAPADQDDIWELNKLEIMKGDIKEGVTLVHCNSAKFYGVNFEEKKIFPSYRKFEGRDVRQLFLFNTIEGHAMLVQRRVAETTFPLSDNIYFDWWLGFQAALLGKVVWNKNYLINRRMHEQNFSELQMAMLRKDKGQLKQALYYTQHFTKAASENEQAAAFGEKLGRKLEQAIRGKKSPLFFFMFRYRKILFYYKPSKPIIGLVSYLKAISRFLNA
ncbi:MAG: glycosyltransferase [Chitinophagaceae bacterium]|nr:glycosyltransferase [Chitinophagaceae bacterium]